MTFLPIVKLKNILWATINPATEDKQWTEWATPPTIVWTGIIWWLRWIYEKLLDVTHINIHTSNKELRVYSEWHICSHNSTDTPLLANWVFNWDWQDTIDYTEIIVSISADQNSATDWLVVHWSSDWITTNETDEFSILANHWKTFSFPCNRKYVKITYTNWAVAQTVFDIQTLLKRFTSKGSSHRIRDSIVADDDAILVKWIITWQRYDWIFWNATLDNENRIQVSSQPYLYWIADSAIAWHSSLLKFWTRTSIAAWTQSVIREWPNAAYTYLTSAEQLKVSSSNAQDWVWWTWLLTLKLYWLDWNYNEIDEIITMNWVTSVTTTKSFIRIFRAIWNTSGSSFSNVWNITITNNAWTNVLVYIPAWDWQTLMTMWTVPVNKVAYITQVSASNDSGKWARFSLYTRQLDWWIIYPWAIKYRAYLVWWNNVVPFNIPFKIPAKTDIEIRFTTPIAAWTTSWWATFELWYKNV